MLHEKIVPSKVSNRAKRSCNRTNSCNRPFESLRAAWRGSGQYVVSSLGYLALHLVYKSGKQAS